MKSLAALVASLSLTCSIAGSAMADTDGGAKGLFFEQLSRPADSLNTGIQYWIELHHDGKTIHATNKTAFHTGDKIRFHIRPNIDGYAYIMLRSGSKGESAVLFPEKGRSEDNKISRGKEMVLPNDGTFGFDENPGVEKLTLLISRTPINADNYISGSGSGSSSEVAPKMVAMASSGSKDLIPNQVLVSYLPNAVTTAVPEAVKAAIKTSNTKTTTTKQVASNSTKTTPVQTATSTTKTTRYNHKASVATPVARTEKTKNLALGSTASTKTERTVPAPVVHVEKDDAHKSELVTVVYKNPNGVLAADISLEHKE